MTNYKLNYSEELKRKFYKWHYENQLAVSADICDWWLSEIDTLLDEIEKECVPKKRSLGFIEDNKLYNELVKKNMVWNQAIDQIKANLKKYRE